MKLTEKDFIHRQLVIIQNKINDEELGRYAALLSAADLSKEVKDYLKRAIDMKQKELHPISPMVEVCNENDFEGE